MEVAPANIDESGSTTKRRKIGELKMNSCWVEDGENGSNNNLKMVSGSSEVIINNNTASCCSSNESVTENLQFSDLGVGEISLHHLQSKSHIGYLTKTESEKKSEQSDSRRNIPPEKTPPAAEIEEFFASAEKALHDSFKNKYNFDVVNEVPLKGRFEWCQVKK